MKTHPHKASCYCKECERVTLFNSGFTAGLAHARQYSGVASLRIAERVIAGTVGQGGVPLLCLPQRRGQLRMPMVDETSTGFFTIRRQDDLELTLGELRSAVAAIVTEETT